MYPASSNHLSEPDKFSNNSPPDPNDVSSTVLRSSSNGVKGKTGASGESRSRKNGAMAGDNRLSSGSLSVFSLQATPFRPV
ncbi:MAG TPA: hypothetical protein VF599_24120 [Pyrinomonadaceae bacterium]